MRNYVKMRIIDSVTLGALATNDVQADFMGFALVSDGRVSSIDGVWTMRGGAADEGPVVFGVAHHAYTDAEIEECLEAQTQGQDTLIMNERSNRLVREIGVFRDLTGQDQVFNDNRPVKTKLNWHCQESAEPFKAWAYNISSATLTTGALLLFMGKANLFLD